MGGQDTAQAAPEFERVDFYLDGPGYSAELKTGFLLGVEFATIMAAIDNHQPVSGKPVCPRNVDRIRQYAANRGLTVHVEPIIGFVGWVRLTVLSARGAVAFAGD